MTAIQKGNYIGCNILQLSLTLHACIKELFCEHSIWGSYVKVQMCYVEHNVCIVKGCCKRTKKVTKENEYVLVWPSKVQSFLVSS